MAVAIGEVKSPSAVILRTKLHCSFNRFRWSMSYTLWCAIRSLKECDY
jgi:hypothetical protein